MTQKQRDDLLISVAKGVNNLQIEVNEIRKDLKKTNEKVDENTVEIKKNRKMIEENTKKIEENTRMIEENTRQIKEVKANLSNLEKFTYENFEGVRIVFQDFPEYIDKKMNILEGRIENNENDIRNIKAKLA